MSIRQGNKVIAGVPSRYHPDLFDWKWSDHICNDVQWLRADTFSWQSGSVYQAAFNELFYDIQISTYWYGSGGPAYTKSRTPAVGDEVYLNSDLTTQIGTVDSYDDVNDEITVSGDTYSYMSNTYVTPTTETVAGYSLSVYTGHSGRKIVSAGDETNVANIYTATGVAWYYIIDIPNKRFKLPRVNPDKEKVLTIPSTSSVKTTKNNAQLSVNYGTLKLGIGDGVTTSTLTPYSNNSDNNYVRFDSNGTAGWVDVYADLSGVTTDYDGKKYLYFYVGEFTQTALENTAGITAETLNDKVDVGHQVIAFQAPTALNNYTWYRKYVDGWVEQGQLKLSPGSGEYTITFPVPMADNKYTVLKTMSTSSTAQPSSYAQFSCYSLTTTTVKTNTAGADFSWVVYGMAA